MERSKHRTGLLRTAQVLGLAGMKKGLAGMKKGSAGINNTKQILMGHKRRGTSFELVIMIISHLPPPPSIQI